MLLKILFCVVSLCAVKEGNQLHRPMVCINNLRVPVISAFYAGLLNIGKYQLGDGHTFKGLLNASILEMTKPWLAIS